MHEAIAYVLNERRRMLDALVAMGFAEAYELEPKTYGAQLNAFAAGDAKTIGTEDDPFVLMAGKRPVARYYIQALKGRCVVVLKGTEQFMSMWQQLTQRDACTTLH